MGENWDKKDDKSKKKRDMDYVSNDNGYEIPHLARSIHLISGKSNVVEITELIHSCMDEIGTPFPTKTITACVNAKLK